MADGKIITPKELEKEFSDQKVGDDKEHSVVRVYAHDLMATVQRAGEAVELPKENKAESTFKHLLKNRMSRLQRLLELDAPVFILAQESMLVFKAAVGLNPKVAGDMLAEMLDQSVRLTTGICLTESCGGRVDVGADERRVICPACKLLEKVDGESTEN